MRVECGGRDRLGRETRHFESGSHSLYLERGFGYASIYISQVHMFKFGAFNFKFDIKKVEVNIKL